MPGRQITLLEQWAKTAETVIPATPVKGTTYRDETLDATDIDNAWPFDTIVDSSDFNQFLYIVSTLMRDVEKRGVIEWSDKIDYEVADGALVTGSDGLVYQILQDSGPTSTVKDPTSEPLYWEEFGGGAEFEVVEVTSSTAIEDKKIYIANSASVISFNLPSTFIQGFQFAIVGKGTGGWRINSNAGAASQKIVFQDDESPEAVSEVKELFASESKYGYAEFIAITANTVITAISPGDGKISGISNYFGDGSDGDVVFSVNTNLTSVVDGDIVVKNYQNITINSGITVTTSNRCRGLLLFADGDVEINGILSMTARGCHANPATVGTDADTPVAAGDGNNVGVNGIQFPFVTAAGSDTLSAAGFEGCGSALYALISEFPELSANGDIIAFPRVGGAGGVGVTGVTDGLVGTAGSTNQSGGGGSGGVNQASFSTGDGSAGTCFSGGAGSGGLYNQSLDGDDAGLYGGVGSDGVTGSTGPGGGAGNPGGSGVGGQDGEDGTGGLLIIICSGNITVGAGGIISANGKNGGNTSLASTGGGGASGGGNIALIRVGTYTNNGTVEAAGGTGGTDSGFQPGGNGGAGSIQTLQVEGAI